MESCFYLALKESTKTLSHLTLFLSSLLFPLLYITPLYIVSRGRGRNDADVIWRRICVSCIWVPLFSGVLVDQARRASSFSSVDPSCHNLLKLLGLRGFSAQAILLGALPILVLFSGSLVTLLLDGEVSTGLSRRRPVEWIRDILVAPFTEEICFRSALMSFLWLGGMNISTIIWFSPMVFGVSHIHHVYDMVYSRNIAWMYAVMGVLFQFAYTTVFGWYAAVLYAKTGQLVAPFVAHAVCNFFGVPRFGELRHKSTRDAQCIILCHVCGICGFILTFSWVILP